jgi:RNA polymerase-binding transcription factor DksA
MVQDLGYDPLLDGEFIVNEKQIQYFKTVLENLLKHAKEDLEKIEIDILENKKDAGLDIDQVDIINRRDLLLSLKRAKERKEKHILSITSSLEDINAVPCKYGICVATGNKISVARLLAKPTAKYSESIQNLTDLYGKSVDQAIKHNVIHEELVGDDEEETTSEAEQKSNPEDLEEDEDE